MKKLTIILFGLFALGCSGSGGSLTTTNTGSAPTVQGKDLSGTYVAQQIECFDSSMTTVTSIEQLSLSGIYTDTLTIDGALFTDSVVVDNAWTNCTVTVNGEVQFMPTVQVTHQVVGQGCNQIIQIGNTLSAGNLIPTDFQYGSYAQSMALTNIDDLYLSDATHIWMPTYFGAGSQPPATTSQCFVKYQKQ